MVLGIFEPLRSRREHLKIKGGKMHTHPNDIAN